MGTSVRTMAPLPGPWSPGPMPSTSPVVDTLTVVAAVGAGTSGGVFFAFSTFVMASLDQLAPAESIRAMQAINVKAPNPLFMTALLGTGVLCAELAVTAVVHRDRPGSALLLTGALVDLVGVAVTVAVHVPRNDALAALGPAPVEAAQEWARYSGPWTAWNHVRTVAGVAGAALLTLAVRASAGA